MSRQRPHPNGMLAAAPAPRPATGLASDLAAAVHHRLQRPHKVGLVRERLEDGVELRGHGLAQLLRPEVAVLAADVELRAVFGGAIELAEDLLDAGVQEVGPGTGDNGDGFLRLRAVCFWLFDAGSVQKAAGHQG